MFRKIGVTLFLLSSGCSSELLTPEPDSAIVEASDADTEGAPLTAGFTTLKNGDGTCLARLNVDGVGASRDDVRAAAQMDCEQAAHVPNEFEVGDLGLAWHFVGSTTSGLLQTELDASKARCLESLGAGNSISISDCTSKPARSWQWTKGPTLKGLAFGTIKAGDGSCLTSAGRNKSPRTEVCVAGQKNQLWARANPPRCGNLVCEASAGENNATCALDCPVCPKVVPKVVGHLADNRIHEASGLVVSRKNPGILWVHNDSNDQGFNENRIFAINRSGQTIAELTIPNVRNLDWEDVAIDNDGNLYIGEIGDNYFVRPEISIYKVPEPKLDTTHFKVIAATGVTRSSYRYPFGPRNAESVGYDPVSKSLYLITKTLDGTRNSAIFRLPPNPSPSPVMMVFEGYMRGDDAMTAMDISSKGNWIGVRSYANILLYRRKGTVAHTLMGKPCVIPNANEPLSEALGFSPDEKSFYTTSENLGSSHQRVLQYALP